MTFDLFSALIDSRTGGSATSARLADERGWAVGGEVLYDVWDARNKASRAGPDQLGALCRAQPARAGRRLRRARARRRRGRPAGFGGQLAAVARRRRRAPALADRHPVGVLSNVDDDVFAGTKVAGFVDGDAVLTSERLGAYKPSPQIYRRARERAGGHLVHIATSARDVRGALEAGIQVIRVRRPGHRLDPDGPTPAVEVDDLAAVVAALEEAPGP